MPDGALVAARALHGEWLATETGRISEASPSLVLAALSQFAPVPVIPDLSSTKLTIERVTVTDQPGGPHAPSRLSRQPRLSSQPVRLRNGDLPSQMVQEATALERVYGWEVDGSATCSSPRAWTATRFDLIADEVEAATRAACPSTNNPAGARREQGEERQLRRLKKTRRE